MTLHIKKSNILLRIFLFSLLGVAASELARLRLDGGRIVTSSTLRWVPGTGSIPQHSIPVVEDDVSTVWCRAKQHGTYVGGSFHSGICTAPFLEMPLKVSEGYEILVSINGSARVKPFIWDKYKASPHNAIASSEKDKQFLAYSLENGSIQAGYLIPSERKVHIVDGEKVRKSDHAIVLAEDEPVGYELRAISLDKKRMVVSNESEVLTEVELVNEGTSSHRIVENVDLTIRHLVYWGLVKGTLVGTKAQIFTPKPEEETQDITWGVQNEFEKVYSQYVEYELPPGTKTNVKIIGTVRKTESNYVSTLTALYDDGARLSRVIEGLHMDERLLSLHAEYSIPVYIHNNTQLDMEKKVQLLYQSTTTTTTTTSTTTTTIPTTNPSSPSSSPEHPWVSMVRPEEPQTNSLENPTGRDARDHNSVSHGIWSLPSKLLIIITIVATFSFSCF